MADSFFKHTTEALDLLDQILDHHVSPCPTSLKVLVQDLLAVAHFLNGLCKEPVGYLPLSGSLHSLWQLRQRYLRPVFELELEQKEAESLRQQSSQETESLPQLPLQRSTSYAPPSQLESIEAFLHETAFPASQPPSFLHGLDEEEVWLSPYQSEEEASDEDPPTSC